MIKQESKEEFLQRIESKEEFLQRINKKTKKTTIEKIDVSYL